MKRLPARLLIVLSVAAVAVGTPPSRADAERVGGGFWSVQLENDMWGSGDDRFYTHGTQVSYANLGRPPAIVGKITEFVPFYRGSEQDVHGWSVGQKIYTPEDITSRTPDERDRPYAGWLFANFGVANLFRSEEGEQTVNGLILTLGVVGPASLADKVQSEVHRIVDAPIPRGWEHQLDNELGVNLTYIRKWRYFRRTGGPAQFELSPHVGLALGNVYTYSALGLMMRWGTQLENDVGPPNIAPGFPGIPAFRRSPALNWYFYTGIEGRAVGRNIFLDGNTFSDSHSVEKKPFVTDLQFGVAFHYGDVRIALSKMVRGKEFEGQREATQYGAINLTFYR